MSLAWSTSVLLLLAGCALAHPSGFPPGWNSLALKPPLGWRSWNAFGARVSQKIMQDSMDALVAKQWKVEGTLNMSLFDVGYRIAGVDEGWEGCGQGVNGTQHDAEGNPVINSKFPDMAGLVKYGHDRGLKVGWYENGCACGEHHALIQNYKGDVAKLHELGFDGVKLDGCGAQRNMTFYAELMEETGKAYLIENCHWGRCTDSDDSSCPTADWCPFNWYRSSGDINSSPMSWLANLQTTIRFQDPVSPLSRPGCWAYPDMLEVGRIMINGKMNFNWNRAHFGAWCIVSAPLILGLDISQQALVAPVIDIIANREAIEVNQIWAGHPGALVWSGLGGAQGFPAARKCDLDNIALNQRGWSLKELGHGIVQVLAPGGGCLMRQGGGYPGGAGGLVLKDCNASVSEQVFKYNETTLQLSAAGHCVDVHSGGPIVWMYGCSATSSNDLFRFHPNNRTFEGAGLCIGKEAEDPAGSTYQSTMQAWAKPLGDSVAVLLINPDIVPYEFSVPTNVLPKPVNGSKSPVAVRDIWAHTDVAPIEGNIIKMTVGGQDSAFLRLTPKSQLEHQWI